MKKLFGQLHAYLEDCRSRDTVREQVIELSSYEKKSCRCVLIDDVVCYLRNEDLPVWWRYWCLIIYDLTAIA